ncbi:MAG: anti-sigma factor antagonist [Eubacterium sp.]|nr:anti-sigma factor antagonist [Eubacterium sp.]
MTINGTFDNDILTIFLEGRIDSANAAAAEQEIEEVAKPYPKAETILDLEKLEYISSAGLRIILRLRKNRPSLRVINASSDVYGVLEMTGFTEMMPVEKAFRQISVDGCEVIGEGANGKVYRINDDTIIKVFKSADSLPEIRQERELARKAFVMGIPTAISYDVVKVGDSYGSVFELLNARSMAQVMTEEPSKVDDLIDIFVRILKQIHSTKMKPGELPDCKELYRKRCKVLKGFIKDEYYEKISRMIEEVPESPCMLHGDYHVKNLMMQGDEAMLIDMDTLCMGDPVFEFAGIYSAFVGFVEFEPDDQPPFLEVSKETCFYIWKQLLIKYFETDDSETLERIGFKCALLGQVRIMERAIRRNGGKKEGSEIAEVSEKHISEFIQHVDNLIL